MNRFNSLLSAFIIFNMCFTLVVFTNYKTEGAREFKEHHLDAAVNYAVDAAVEEMLLGSSDLWLDYADFEYASINPEIALQTYCEVLLDNLGYVVTNENIQMIKTSKTPCFIVACYDGYYVGAPITINYDAGTRDLIFSEKKPYLYELGGTYYALNLGLNDCKKVQNGVVTKVSASETGLTTADQRRIINQMITTDFMKTVLRYNNSSIDLKSEILIPSNTSLITGANDIKSPSVLAYCNNIFLGPGKYIESFGIGGARLTHADFVGVYMRTDESGQTRKYYVPTRLKPDGVIFTHIYETAEEAAKDGYYPDIRYFK